MEAPPVQYVRTSDGYDIAYCVRGEGTPLVLLPWGLNDMASIWVSRRSWIGGLAERFRLVQLDFRGRGMSGHGLRPDHSVHDFGIDLTSVVDRLALDPFIILTVGGFGHAAVRYAFAHPQRVRALVLDTCPLATSAYPGSYMEGLAAENWPYFVRNNLPRGLSGDSAEQWLERWLSPASHSDWLVNAAAALHSDISQELTALKIPVLVVHSSEFPMWGPEESMKVASSIPDARLVIYGRLAEYLAAIDAFLAELGQVASTLGEQSPLSRRELDVLRLLAVGKSNQEIADELVISASTVAKHVSSILNKTQSRNRAEATSFAHRHHLL